MIVFSTNGKITHEDDKTNIKHTFTVGAGVKSLTVKYSYSPKIVEDKSLATLAVTNAMKKYKVESLNSEAFFPVKNLVTLSFDECGNYRGACHRQPNEQIITIAPQNSTPGIFNREITPGEWDVVLNIHYAGCDIDYEIEIDAKEEKQ